MTAEINPVTPTFRILGCGDDSVLANVALGVFDNAVDWRWTAEFLADSRHHLAVALDGDRVEPDCNSCPIGSIQCCKDPAIKNFFACPIARYLVVELACPLL